MGGVDEQDVAGSLFVRRHPEQAVELLVPSGCEGMRAIGIDELPRQDMHRLGVLGRNFVVRQVQVKIECGDVVQQSHLVEVAERGQRCNLLRPFHDCRTKPPLIDDRDVERLHQRACVLAESLLARHESRRRGGDIPSAAASSRP